MSNNEMRRSMVGVPPSASIGILRFFLKTFYKAVFCFVKNPNLFFVVKFLSLFFKNFTHKNSRIKN